MGWLVGRVGRWVGGWLREEEADSCRVGGFWWFFASCVEDFESWFGIQFGIEFWNSTWMIHVLSLSSLELLVGWLVGWVGEWLSGWVGGWGRRRRLILVQLKVFGDSLLFYEQFFFFFFKFWNTIFMIPVCVDSFPSDFQRSFCDFWRFWNVLEGFPRIVGRVSVMPCGLFRSSCSGLKLLEHTKAISTSLFAILHRFSEDFLFLFLFFFFFF